MYKILLSVALLFSALFAQAQSVRLKSEAHYNYWNSNFNQQDTVILYYSWGNDALPQESGSFNYLWTWAADTIKRWTLTSGQMVNPLIVQQFFDNDGRLSTAYTISSFNGFLDTINRNIYHYDNNKLDSVHYEDYDNGSWTPTSRTIYVYNQYGIITNLFQNWNSTLNQYENYRVYSYIYNSSGQVIETERDNWVNNAWVQDQKTNYVYMGNNIDTTYFDFPSFSPLDDMFTVHTYDVNNDNVENTSYMLDGSNYELHSKRFQTFNNAHSRLSETYQSYLMGQFVNSFQNLSTYNSYNLKESDIHYSGWDGTQFFPEDDDSKHYWYYEEFDPASTGNVVKQNVTLQVFPNPATNSIQIQSFTEQKEMFGVTIYDATGKSVRHWNEPPASMYQKQVDVSVLPSGNYYLRVDNRPQEAVPFTIIK